METLAVTNWNDIISPLYDAACSLLILRPHLDTRTTTNIQELSVIEKADLCKRENVSVLICGAISKLAFSALNDRGIKVLPWVRGPVNEVVGIYRAKGELIELYAMPGCRKRFCRKGITHSNHRGNWKNRSISNTG